ncbi:MAG: hypothetical protein II777_08830 [Clostridia bacterium]|nr:hypothetical protein [Clostridia bacterium]
MKKILSVFLMLTVIAVIFTAAVYAADPSVKQCNYDAAVTTGNDLYFRGWAVVENGTVADLGYRLDDEAPVYSVKDDRPDVSEYFGVDPSVVGGFDFHLFASDLAAGEHLLHVVVKTESGAVLDINPSDRDGFVVTGTKTETPSTDPFVKQCNYDSAAIGDEDLYFKGWVIVENDTVADLGYRLDDDAPVYSVKADRPDVSDYFGVDPSVVGGFDFHLDPADIEAGEHVLHVVVKTAKGAVLDINPSDRDGFTVNGFKAPDAPVDPGDEPDEPDEPAGTSDAAVIAAAAVGCMALAGAITVKKVK